MNLWLRLVISLGEARDSSPLNRKVIAIAINQDNNHFQQYHVALVTRAISHDTSFLSGIFELDQARALRDYGHKVTIVSFDWRSVRRRRKWGIQHEKIDSIDVITASVPMGPVHERLYDCIEPLVVDAVAKTLVNDIGKPDILHAHFARAGSSAVYLKKKMGIPLVYTEHSSSILNHDKKYIALAKKSLVNADAVVAVSETLAKHMQSICACKPVIVGNIVDSHFLNGEMAKRLNKMRFVATGSLVPGKGYVELLNAFAGLPDCASLEIFGDGPSRRSLEKTIADLGISERVRLRGQCDRAVIAESYKQADCFVLASRFETFGVAYIEAMAAGLPVVATRCGGPESFINDSVGILVNVGDTDSLREAMLFVGASSQYDSAKIRGYIDSRYSAGVIASRLTELYTSFIK